MKLIIDNIGNVKHAEIEIKGITTIAVIMVPEKAR